MKWQGIESAPKDGTEILGYEANGGICIYHWDDQRYHKKPKPYWKRWFYGAGYDRGQQPTHWMPLPEPPTGEGVEMQDSNEVLNLPPSPAEVERLRKTIDKAMHVNERLRAQLQKCAETFREEERLARETSAIWQAAGAVPTNVSQMNAEWYADLASECEAVLKGEGEKP
jgi:hypothetical protein